MSCLTPFIAYRDWLRTLEHLSQRSQEDVRPIQRRIVAGVVNDVHGPSKPRTGRLGNRQRSRAVLASPDQRGGHDNAREDLLRNGGHAELVHEESERRQTPAAPGSIRV